jgi:hypothetical protein
MGGPHRVALFHFVSMNTIKITATNKDDFEKIQAAVALMPEPVQSQIDTAMLDRERITCYMNDYRTMVDPRLKVCGIIQRVEVRQEEAIIYTENFKFRFPISGAFTIDPA